MAGSSWNVIRCTACSTCHGHRTMGSSCPHCGQRLEDSAEVVATVQSASQLRIEVALANTPEELRDMLRVRLEKNEHLFSSEEPESAPQLSKILLQSANHAGVVEPHKLQILLDKSSASVEAGDLIAMAESQGMLVRVGDGTWQVLE